jgi:hypothetical protein
MTHMPLTNSAWEKNLRLQTAANGGNSLRKGDAGTHVAILRKNLEAVGFERSLEPTNFYGASTADSYYQTTWREAPRNPDAYPHFAYQVTTGKQNFRAWGGTGAP